MISAASGQGRWGTWAEQAAVQVATRHELSTLALDGLILFRDACSMTLMAGSSATRLMLCRFFFGKNRLNRGGILKQIVVTGNFHDCLFFMSRALLPSGSDS